VKLPLIILNIVLGSILLWQTLQVSTPQGFADDVNRRINAAPSPALHRFAVKD
jgi:hypothetical protein